MNKVFINRYGICSALGVNIKEHVASIQDERLTPPVVKIDIKEAEDTHVMPYYKAKAGIDTLLEQIGKLPRDTVLFVGSSSFGVELNEKDYKNEGIKYLGYDINIPNICKKLNISLNYYLFNTACTSSANAIIYAARLIQAKIIKNALVLGVEVPNMLSFYGFMSLGLVSKSGIFPFDKDRDGIVLGEGYGFVVLGDKDGLWEFKDGESLNDTNSVTSPSPDGKTLELIIQKIIKRSSLEASQIDLIKLHATASDSNDISENAALCKVFQKIPTSVALKGYIGHTLGACGVCELALLLGSLESGIIPKSLGFFKKDDSFCVKPSIENSTWSGNYALLNYLAFGGNTSSLLIKKSFS